MIHDEQSNVLLRVFIAVRNGSATMSFLVQQRSRRWLVSLLFFSLRFLLYSRCLFGKAFESFIMCPTIDTLVNSRKRVVKSVLRPGHGLIYPRPRGLNRMGIILTCYQCVVWSPENQAVPKFLVWSFPLFPFSQRELP